LKANPAFDRAKLQALDVLCESSTDDENSLVSDPVEGSSAIVRIHEETTEDDVTADENEWDAPKHEVKRCA
jgi:hypothetical protein